MIWAKEVLPRCLEICERYGFVYIQSIIGDGTRQIDGAKRYSYARNEFQLSSLIGCCYHDGCAVGVESAAAGEVVAAVRKSVNIPVFTKIASRNEEVDRVAAPCSQVGVDGISVFNNPVGTWVDVENQTNFGIPVKNWGWALEGSG